MKTYSIYPVYPEWQLLLCNLDNSAGSVIDRYAFHEDSLSRSACLYFDPRFENFLVSDLHLSSRSLRDYIFLWFGCIKTAHQKSKLEINQTEISMKSDGGGYLVDPFFKITLDKSKYLLFNSMLTNRSGEHFFCYDDNSKRMGCGLSSDKELAMEKVKWLLPFIESRMVSLDSFSDFYTKTNIAFSFASSYEHPGLSINRDYIVRRDSNDLEIYKINVDVLKDLSLSELFSEYCCVAHSFYFEDYTLRISEEKLFEKPVESTVKGSSSAETETEKEKSRFERPVGFIKKELHDPKVEANVKKPIKSQAAPRSGFWRTFWRFRR